MKSDAVKRGRNQTMQKVMECYKKIHRERKKESIKRMNEWTKKKTSARICIRLRNIASVCMCVCALCAVDEHFSLQFMFHDHASYSFAILYSIVHVIQSSMLSMYSMLEFELKHCLIGNIQSSVYYDRKKSKMKR